MTAAYSTTASDYQQRKHPSYVSQALCERNHQWLLTSPWEWLSTSDVTFIHINDVNCVYMVTVLHDNSLYSQSCYKVYYIDVIMSVMASQITSVSIVYSTICSGADRRKRQRSASLAFVRGIHQWPVNPPHKGPVMWKMFPFDDVIMHGQYHNTMLHTAHRGYWAHCWVNINKPHLDGWTMVTKAGYRSHFWAYKRHQYLTLMGELWDVYCEYFRQN